MNPATPATTSGQPSQPLLLRATDIAERLQLNVQTVRRLCATGELPATKFGTEWRISSSALESWVNKLHPIHISTRHRAANRNPRNARAQAFN